MVMAKAAQAIWKTNNRNWKDCVVFKNFSTVIYKTVQMQK